MPELPEVETTKTSLLPLVGKQVCKVIIHQPKLREMMPTDLDSLVGFCLTQVVRRAKYLILTFYHHQDNATKKLLIHLGMSGSLQQHPTNKNAPNTRKHDHLIILFKNDTNTLTALHYHDPRRFGIITWLYNDGYLDGVCPAKAKYLDHLGIEPLDDVFDVDYLYDVIHQAKTPIKKPIKALIMEQTVVVGVGNIYAAESLFLSGIHPNTPAHLIDKDKLAVLVTHIKAILQKSIQQGGSSLKDFTVGAGKTGYFQQTLLVYGRANEPCVSCQTPLENVKIGGRASVYCPICQPQRNSP